MAVNETIVTGRYFRRCTDAANKVWQRISFWHKASDCEFDDGTTAQTKVGAIKGITTSTSVTETGYAADMTTVKGLQTQIDELKNSNLGNVNVPNGMYLAVTGGLSFTLESKGISKEIISHLKFVAGYVGDFSGRNEDYGLSQYRHYGAIVKYENGIVTANPSNGYAAVMGSAGGSSSGWTRFNSVCAVFQYI